MIFLIIGALALFVPILASGRGIGTRRLYVVAAALSIAGGLALHAFSFSIYRPAGDLADSVLIPLGSVLLAAGVGLVVAALIAKKICPACDGRVRRLAVVCGHCGRDLTAGAKHEAA